MVRVFAVVLAFSLAACGGDANGPVPEKPANVRSHTEAEVVGALDLQETDGGLSWDDPAGDCSVAVVMTTPAEVSTYADAGDAVATNPSRSAGVKYGGDDPSACYERYTKKLRALP